MYAEKNPREKILAFSVRRKLAWHLLELWVVGQENTTQRERERERQRARQRMTKDVYLLSGSISALAFIMTKVRGNLGLMRSTLTRSQHLWKLYSIFAGTENSEMSRTSESHTQKKKSVLWQLVRVQGEEKEAAAVQLLLFNYLSQRRVYYSTPGWPHLH